MHLRSCCCLTKSWHSLNSTTIIFKCLWVTHRKRTINHFLCMCGCYIFWHVIPHPFQNSNLVFHYSLKAAYVPPPAPVLGGLHPLSLWSSSIGCIELSSLIHFAQRHYLYPYIPPAEGSQYRNFNIKDSLLAKNKRHDKYNQIPSVFFSSFFCYIFWFYF